MIKCLSEEVQARLRSGIAIFSLQQCVEELVLNSVDAGATCIAVRLDMEACKVQVVDNGSGMGREDMEQVGKRYFTSKCSSLEDLESLRFFGFRGEAVASIASLATVVEISSRTNVSVKTFVKIFKDGKGMDTFESESSRPSAGTTVVICNFFHNMPVRRKRMDAVLECERIRQRVEAISLMHPSISLTLKNDCTGAMVVQLPKARSTYYRFVQIHGLVRAQKLGEISLSHGQFEISGYMGREGHYNNSLQFLFVNCRLILKTRIHKLLNFLLKKMSGSSRLNGSPNVSSAIGSPKQRAGAELHGVYLINIKCHYSEYDICLEPAKTLIEFKDWDGVLSCLEEGVKKFLTRENLVAELSPEDVHDYVHGNDFIEPVASPRHVEGSAAMHALASTISIPGEQCNGKKLMSKAVHRKLVQDLDRVESVQVDNKFTKGGEEGKELRVVDTPRDLEETKEHAPLKVACMAHSFDSETGAWEIWPGTDMVMSEPLKDIEDKESHQNVQVFSTSDSQCSELQYSVNTKAVANDEQQRMSPEEYKTDDTGKQSSETHYRKNYECCNDGQLHNTRLGKNISGASDPGRTELQLASVGFIKYLVHQPINTEVPKMRAPEGLSRLCCLGSASVPDLLPHKQCSSRDYQNFTSETLASKHSINLSSQKIASSVSALEAQEKSLWAPKRKLSLSGEPSFIASKISKGVLCPKLTLSIGAGTLDRFRRIYGKQAGTQCRPLETDCSQTALDARTFLTECMPDNAEQFSLCQSEEGEPSDTLEIHSVRSSDSPLTLSEYTRLKPFTAQTRSSEGSLAAKLSRLKHHQLKDKSNTLPLDEISNFISSLNSTMTDALMQHDCNTENLTCAPLPSTDDVTPDMNSNYQQPVMEKHSNTSDSTGPAEFRNAFTTTPNMPTPVLFAGDCIGDPLQMVTTHNPDLCSSEVEKLTEKDGPLCSDTTHGGRMQSESTAAGSSDWLEHFDDSVGKLVYINKLTGLSKYEASTVEEAQVPCTTDVTTMSISVISGKDGSAAANSLSFMFSEWSNPVFVRPPEVAVDVTSGQAEGLAVKIHNVLYPYRFTKDMIHSMKVVHQVDKKFLACLIDTRDQVDAESSHGEGNLLVLVDQHAAHERVRLENLVTESYEDDPEAPGQKRLRSSCVTPPLEIEVTEEELRLLRSCQLFLRGLGLEIRFAEAGDPRLLVGKVPVCFVEREASELRHGRHTATKAIVEEYIREQIELLRSAGRVRGTLPLTVLKVLASQACHGAIKFNDSLSLEECYSLVGSLSTCQLPFQCAHGRPSMVPLADLLHLDNGHQESTKPNLAKLRRMYRAWELYGKN